MKSLAEEERAFPKISAWHIRYYRKKKNWTREKLAYESGLSYAQIARLEKSQNKRRVPKATIDALAHALELDAMCLMS